MNNSNSDQEEEVIYYGQLKCENPCIIGSKRCDNGAYYVVVEKGKKRYLCGVHSRRWAGVGLHMRKKLPKDPRAKEKREIMLEKYKISCAKEAAKNKKNGRVGSVVLYKMRMMKRPPLEKGIMNVFPNNKHGNAKDGWGMPYLSPMRLGPVPVGAPGGLDVITQATNIENYHQFSKVFSNEVDEKGNPLPVWHERRRDGFADKTPHRHKFPREELKKMAFDGNPNIPLYSLHYDLKDGHFKRYTYVESRQFYCHHYAVLAKETRSFAELTKALRDGYNLRICGYDARKVEPTEKAIWEAYLDPTYPFGHELVLFTMLVMDNPARWPWNWFRGLKENYMKLHFYATYPGKRNPNVMCGTVPDFESGSSSSNGEEEKEKEEEEELKEVPPSVPVEIIEIE
jgi:hypothetical protein